MMIEGLDISIFPNGIKALQSSLFLIFSFGHHQFLLSFHMKCLLLEDFYTKFWLQNVCVSVVCYGWCFVTLSLLMMTLMMSRHTGQCWIVVIESKIIFHTELFHHSQGLCQWHLIGVFWFVCSIQSCATKYLLWFLPWSWIVPVFVISAPVQDITVMRWQRRRDISSFGAPQHSGVGLVSIFGLAPVFPFQSVEEYEASNEAEVEKQDHNDRGNDGGLWTADVAWVSNIWNGHIKILHSLSFSQYLTISWDGRIILLWTRTGWLSLRKVSSAESWWMLRSCNLILSYC